MRLLALCLFLVGCASSPDAPLAGGWDSAAPVVQVHRTIGYRVDDSVIPYMGYLLDGASAWRTFGFELVEDVSAERYVRCAEIPGELGHTDGTGIELNCEFLATDLQRQYATPEKDAQRIRFKQEMLAHEFGHYLGLHHVTDPLAVMYGNIQGSETFTAADIAEYERVYGK